MKSNNKKKRKYSSNSSNDSYKNKKKKTKKSPQKNNENVQYYLDYMNMYGQQQAQQIPLIQSMQPPSVMLNNNLPINIPVKVPTQQPQPQIQKHPLNRQQKDFQPFQNKIQLDSNNIVVYDKKSDIKNIEQLIIFKKNIREIMPINSYYFSQIKLNLEYANPQFVLQISRKILAQYDKSKNYDKKRSQLQKALRGIQQIFSRIKSEKNQEQQDINNSQQVKLSDIDINDAKNFIKLKNYDIEIQNLYNESKQGENLFNQCLQNINQ